MQADRSAAYAVRVPAGTVEVDGDLVVPDRVRGVVLFAHGSGSSRHSPRNRQVATALQRAGYATLLMDLLTADEEARDQQTREHRFDIGLLAGRLTAAVDWLAARADTAELPLALFGASTGAAAALVTAADRADRVRLVISRGGRPDLAGPALGAVRAPTLLVVGGADEEVLRLNREAAAQISAPVDLRVVPGATHLFAEPGALEDVIDLAVAAMDRHLRSNTDEARERSSS
ncbi:MAG TPA: alpha/beta family hydrolase [Propionibacteriaceae bacterium]|nr:alpha/beta family hydrolase [Propionibacteriaceae bacterium]